jgi:hypothetical protein
MFQCQHALRDGKEKDSGMSWATLQNVTFMLTSESDPRFVRPNPRRSSIGENVAKADTSDVQKPDWNDRIKNLNKFIQRGADIQLQAANSSNRIL